MILGVLKIKDPDAVLDYGFDWRAWLAGDTFSQCTFDVPSGIVKDSESEADGIATVWLSGGTPGRTYRITNRVVTVTGRRDNRTLRVQVRER